MAQSTSRLSLVRSQRTIFLAVLGLGMPASCAFGAGVQEPPSWEFLQQANRATRESIRTLSCRVERTTKSSDSRRESREIGLYYYSPKATRVKILERSLPNGNEDVDCLWLDGLRKCKTRQVHPTHTHVSYGIDALADRYWNFSDPFHCGLLVLTVPGAIDEYPVEQWTKLAAKIGKPADIVEGGTLHQVQFAFAKGDKRADPWTVDVFFDPSVNYLIRKAIFLARLPDDTIRRERAVVEFKECQPGVFFPAHITDKMERRGQHYSRTVHISEIQVNQALPRDIFVFRFPHGVEIANSIRGTSYRSDADGKPIGKETPLARVAPPGAAITETEQEPRSSFWRWVLWIALVLLGGAIALWLYRRSRRRSDDPRPSFAKSLR